MRRRAIGGSWLDRLRSVARCRLDGSIVRLLLARRVRESCSASVFQSTTYAIAFARQYRVWTGILKMREKWIGIGDPDAGLAQCRKPEEATVALRGGRLPSSRARERHASTRSEERNDLIHRKNLYQRESDRPSDCSQAASPRRRLAPGQPAPSVPVDGVTPVGGHGVSVRVAQQHLQPAVSHQRLEVVDVHAVLKAPGGECAAELVRIAGRDVGLLPKRQGLAQPVVQQALPGMLVCPHRLVRRTVGKPALGAAREAIVWPLRRGRRFARSVLAVAHMDRAVMTFTSPTFHDEIRLPGSRCPADRAPSPDPCWMWRTPGAVRPRPPYRRREAACRPWACRGASATGRPGLRPRGSWRRRAQQSAAWTLPADKPRHTGR